MVKENIYFESSTSKERGSENTDTMERKYERIAQPLALIVKEISNLNVPENTINDWKTVGNIMYIVDNKIDSITNQKERNELQARLENSLNGKQEDFSNDPELEKAMFQTHALYENLEESQKKFFVNTLLRILKITEKIKTEKHPKKLVALNRIEGQVCAKVFLPFLPEEFRKSEKYKKLVVALTRLGRAANTFDSLVDMSADYDSKKIKVYPSFLNKTLFLSAITSDSLAMIKETGLPKDLIKKLWENIRADVGDSSRK